MQCCNQAPHANACPLSQRDVSFGVISKHKGCELAEGSDEEVCTQCTYSFPPPFDTAKSQKEATSY
jgi:hypothetical protein